MKRFRHLLLALSSALLLGLAWEPHFSALVLVAFVPLLFIADEFFPQEPEKKKRLRKFYLYYLAFLVWNLISTWWVYNASPAAVIAWTLNSLFMVWTLRLAWWTKKKFNGDWSYFIVIPFWLTFEYLHQHWDLSWTWLTLGNAFYSQTELVQWYEITGTSGGSAWIWAVNILLYLLIKERIQTGSWSRKRSIVLAGVVFIPCMLSYALYVSVDARIKDSQLPSQRFVVVQPNIDPNEEKFSNGSAYVSPQAQLDRTLRLLAAKSDLKGVDYVVFPETFLTDVMKESEFTENDWILQLKEKLIDKHPGLKIITGATTMKDYFPGQKIPATAEKYSDANVYYDYFNAALQIDSNAVQAYHKSKLVPGAEIMPFLSWFPFLEQYALELGGTSGSYGLQEERSVFKSSANISTGPIVCYESIYPEYVSEYVKNGANLLCIITNDGWWGDTPGYKEHLAYGAMRSIETRKPIARSANTGISCFIDERGKVYKATKWWVPDVIEADLHPNTYKTIFVRVGDLCAKISLFSAAALFLFAVYKRFAKR